jgi:hypothetical protein
MSRLTVNLSVVLDIALEDDPVNLAPNLLL